MSQITLILPDDWHLHLRDGSALETTVPYATRGFGRGIVMPNLNPPVTNVARAKAYRDRIIANRPDGSDWEPLMVLYLTDNTSPDEIRAAADCGFIFGCKYYPAGATTNSDSGVTNLDNIDAVLEAMQEVGMVLQIHGEVTDADIDIFDREAVFIERHLIKLVEKFPRLKVIFEHITTKEAAEFVASASENVAATITPQHLLYNRNHMLAGGIRPHYYCLPILKRDIHQQALIEAAVSGNKKFFLGTDSAPHSKDSKESCCGCAGCFSHPAAVEMYAEVFEQANAMDKFEAFASINGADFYDLPYNKTTITLERESWGIPQSVPFGDSVIIPLAAGNQLKWRLKS
jgi:dihydroorotase